MSYTVRQLKDMCRELEIAIDSQSLEKEDAERDLDIAQQEIDKVLDDYHELRQEHDELKRELEALREAKP